MRSLADNNLIQDVIKTVLFIFIFDNFFMIIIIKKKNKNYQQHDSNIGSKWLKTYNRFNKRKTCNNSSSNLWEIHSNSKKVDSFINNIYFHLQKNNIINKHQNFQNLLKSNPCPWINTNEIDNQLGIAIKQAQQLRFSKKQPTMVRNIISCFHYSMFFENCREYI